MFKIGDLVKCTGGYPKVQRIGVVKVVFDDSYKVFFFDPPDSRWSDGVWIGCAMEKIA